MSIYCLGDSNTYGYDPRSYCGDRYNENCRWVDLLSKKTGKHITNGGINGQKIPRTSVFIPNETDFLIVMLGTNDLLQGADTETVALRMERFLKTLPSSLPVLLIAPPSLQKGAWVTDENLITASQALGSYYRALSTEMEMHFTDAAAWDLPLCFDGVHFTEEGHVKFAQQLSHLLFEILNT